MIASRQKFFAVSDRAIDIVVRNVVGMFTKVGIGDADKVVVDMVSDTLDILIGSCMSVANVGSLVTDIITIAVHGLVDLALCSPGKLSDFFSEPDISLISQRDEVVQLCREVLEKLVLLLFVRHNGDGIHVMFVIKCCLEKFIREPGSLSPTRMRVGGMNVREHILDLASELRDIVR